MNTNWLLRSGAAFNYCRIAYYAHHCAYGNLALVHILYTYTFQLPRGLLNHYCERGALFFYMWVWISGVQPTQKQGVTKSVFSIKYRCACKCMWWPQETLILYLTYIIHHCWKICTKLQLLEFINEAGLGNGLIHEGCFSSETWTKCHSW